MSFQGTLRVMQCQICVTDLGERWWRELSVGRERLRADSNSQNKNSSRQPGWKESCSPPPARPANIDQNSHTATSHTLPRWTAFAQIWIFCFVLFFNIGRLECICWIVKPKNMDKAWLIYLISLMARSTWGVVSETTRESNTTRRVHVRSWDSTLFLMSCLPLLVGCSKRKMAEITPCHFTAELKTSKYHINISECRNNKIIIPKKWSFEELRLTPFKSIKSILKTNKMDVFLF